LENNCTRSCIIHNCINKSLIIWKLELFHLSISLEVNVKKKYAIIEENSALRLPFFIFRKKSLFLFLFLLLIKYICVLILQRFRFFVKYLDLISLIGLSYSSNNITISIIICVEVRIISILFVIRNTI
jgi:hypothetical protein